MSPCVLSTGIDPPVSGMGGGGFARRKQEARSHPRNLRLENHLIRPVSKTHLIRFVLPSRGPSWYNPCSQRGVMSDLTVQGSSQSNSAVGESPDSSVVLSVPIPSNSSIPAFKSSSLLTPVVCDERAIGRLLETLLSRSGLSTEEASRRLGVTSNTIRQYLHGRRNKPSLLWFVKLATLCGAKVTIEFPAR